MPGTFLQLGTMQSMMFQLPELGLLSLAMAIPLISGGLNLAIIATANQAGAADGLDPDDADAAGRDARRRSWLWIAIALRRGLVALRGHRPDHRLHRRRRSASIRSW